MIWLGHMQTRTLTTSILIALPMAVLRGATLIRWLARLELSRESQAVLIIVCGRLTQVITKSVNIPTWFLCREAHLTVGAQP